MFARTRIFTLIADVYAFDLRSNADLLTKLNTVPEEAETSEEIAVFIERRDEFIRTVKQRASMAQRTRSDENGRYVLTGLEQNVEYLVIAIVPPQEDYEEYFLVETRGQLSGERTIVNIWQGERPREQCHP